MTKLRGRLFKDKLARQIMLGITVLSGVVLLFVGCTLFYKSWPVISQMRLSDLLFTSAWKPSKGQFGFLTFILSTLHVTLIAIL
ncbi:MAG: hypothetical protein LWW85_02065, partial [Marinilabiliales bacterium]|nr:hypothetical protein [Marinilabiliales bacterium]